MDEKWGTYDNKQRLTHLESIIKIVSFRIKDLRKLFLNQTMAIKKFYKEAGENWRSSRLVYAISSVQATIYQIKIIIKRLLDINNRLLQKGSSINETSNAFVVGANTDAFTQRNWISLKEPDNIPEHLACDIRYIKQRSDKWFEKRKQFLLTGSQIFTGVGLETLKNLQKHFDKVIRKINVEQTIPEEVQKRMNHGTESEIHAISTLTGKVLPFYYPDLNYVEEGAHIISKNDNPFILVSPDGSLRSSNIQVSQQPLLTCEFKCPYPEDYKVPVHYEIPVR